MARNSVGFGVRQPQRGAPGPVNFLTGLGQSTEAP